jgi:chromosome transmission fidelity protein 8
MGDLHFSSDGVPILILGNHVLYGKAITLEKPYVLLTKLRTSNSCNNELLMKDLDDDDDKSDMNVSMNETKSMVTYFVKAVIKRKLLFNKRPRPIVYIEATKNRN